MYDVLEPKYGSGIYTYILTLHLLLYLVKIFRNQYSIFMK